MVPKVALYTFGLPINSVGYLRIWHIAAYISLLCLISDLKGAPKNWPLRNLRKHLFSKARQRVNTLAAQLSV